MELYTKNGIPLQVIENTVYSQSGQVVGQIKKEKVYGKNGKYIGTIVDDRLVYRTTDSTTISSPFTAADKVGIAKANRVESVIWGDEPNIPK